MTVCEDRVVRAPQRALDVHLLGPVRAGFSGDQDIPLGGPKPAMVLVRLALRAGEIVTTDSLIDTLWGDDPPPTARRSLQAHVAKLRARLGGDAGPLRSCGSGYVLDLPRQHVDVLRVEDRLREAQQLLPTDPFRASELVAACRDDWTDQPLADLEAYATLAPERERLLRLGDELDDTEVELHVALGDPVSSILRLERAVAEQPTHEPHWIRLITAYYSSGRQQDALEAYRRACRTLREELGVDASPRLRQLEVQILRQELDGGEGREVCPYQGLVSYQIADGFRFYGRPSTIDEIVESVKRAPITAVVGASGAGKSSVLRAGVGHRVVTGQVPGIRSLAVITPGPKPMRSLFELPRVVDLLIVDQFEELFTLTDDAGRRREFVDELIGLSESGRTRVVLAVRADFYEACIGLPGLVRVFERHQVVVGAMSPLDIREAVRGPARQVHLEIESELLDLVIAEVSDHPGALPMMSHALRETWRRRSGSTLTCAAYREAGAIAGAIAITAERLYEGTDEEGRRQMRLLFQRLVEPGSGAQHTRRSATRAELELIGVHPDLVDRLVSARLLTVTTDRVDLSHEALIAAWPRLADWVDTEREHLVVRERLARDAASWAEEGRDETDLYRGHKLDGALAWLREVSPVLSLHEREFLRASETHAEAEVVRQRRANRRLRVLVTVSVVAMLAAGAAGVTAVEFGRDSQQRRVAAEADRLANVIGSDESLSHTERLLAAASVEARSPTLATSQLLFASLLDVTDTVTSDVDISRVVSVAPSYAAGTGLWVLDENTRPAVLDMSTLQLDRLPVDVDAEVVVADASTTFAVAADTYEVISLPEERRLGPPPELARTPAAAALTVDGSTLALGYDAHVDDASFGAAGAEAAPADRHAFVDVVDVASGATQRRLVTGSSSIRGLQFSLDGARLMTDTDSAAFEVWETGAGQRILSVRPDDGSMPLATSSALDRSGEVVAVGYENGAVRIWQEIGAEWRRVAPPVGHGGRVTWLDFDADGSRLVSSGVDGSVVIRNTADGAVRNGPYWFDTYRATISFFDSGDDAVVTIDAVGQVRRWPVRSGGVLVETLEVASTGVPSTEARSWVGTDGGAAVLVDDGVMNPLELDDQVLDVVNGRSGDHAVLFDDRLEWYRGVGEPVLTIPGDWDEPGPNIAIGRSSIAYTDPVEPQQIVIRHADGTVLDEILVRPELWGTISRIDVNPSGTDLIYSTDEGALNWYSLDTFDSGEILSSGRGHDGHFVEDDLAVAVGADGVFAIDFAESSPTVEPLGIGGSATTVAYDQARRLAATADAAGELRLWDIDRRRSFGSLPSVLGGDQPEMLSFLGPDHVLVVGHSHVAEVPVGGGVLLDVACTLLVEDVEVRIDGALTEISVAEVCR